MRQRIFWIAAVLCVLVVSGVLGTYAAFTATTTNAANQISSGTVALSDNDSGAAMYNATGQKPGDVTERCIKVSYDGSLDSTVKLYATAAGSFGSHVDLTVTPGTTTAAFSGCGSFTPDAKGAIYNGTLKGFTDAYTDYTSGLADYPGSQVKWSTGETVAYRFRLTIRDDFAANENTSVLSTTAHSFTFEARNGEYARIVRATPGLVSLWRLGETSGTAATDSAGSNNGTYNGPALNQAGAQSDGNPSVSFDGTDDYVAMGNASSLQANEGTLEAWIKTSNAGSGYRGIVSKAGAYGLYLFNNQLATYDYGTTAGRISDVTLSDGLWHHVAMTYQSGAPAGTVLYVDGVPRYTTTLTIGSNTNSFNIGWGDSTDQQINGRIDEVAFYNRPLTSSEIAVHYNAR